MGNEIEFEVVSPIRQDQVVILLPPSPDKDVKYRIGRFADWLQEQDRGWQSPELATYRDAMLADDYAPSTVSAHLATIRTHYRRLLRDNDLRQRLCEHATRYLEATEQDTSPANVKSLVDEWEKRLENAIDPENSSVRVPTEQDRPDSKDLRLTPAQASMLLAQPGTDTLMGLRDTAIIGLLLASGIREGELVALDVRDLRRELGGELALHVREGKGAKSRLVPYGALDWAPVIVDDWLRAAGIESGPVFRGFYRGGRVIRPGRISKRAVGMILKKYTVAINGHQRVVKSLDLRRSYARLQHDAGLPLVAIQQNLGHADVKTTLGYIGTLDASQRRARSVIQIDSSTLTNRGIGNE